MRERYFQRYQTSINSQVSTQCVRYKTCTLGNKRHPLQAWSVSLGFPWDLPDRTVKNKTPRHIPWPRASISGTLTTLIGWSAMTLPDSSFSPAFQSMQAENGSSDKRDAWRWQFISWPSCLMKPLCHAHWVGAHTTGRRQYRWGKANKDVLCALLFLCDVFFNFLRGGRRLPYLGLFIPANRLVAFCLQVTQPEVTFNSRTKKKKNEWSCSMVQPLSLSRLLI